MLKKTAFSLFGLVVMLVCINPPQARAGWSWPWGQSTRVRFTFVRTRMSRPRPMSFTGRILTPAGRYLVARAGVIRATTGRATTGQGTGVREDSNIASTWYGACTGVARSCQ